MSPSSPKRSGTITSSNKNFYFCYKIIIKEKDPIWYRKHLFVCFCFGKLKFSLNCSMCSIRWQIELMIYWLPSKVIILHLRTIVGFWSFKKICSFKTIFSPKYFIIFQCSYWKFRIHFLIQDWDLLLELLLNRGRRAACGMSLYL